MEYSATCYFIRNKGKNKGKKIAVRDVFFDGVSVIADMNFEVRIKPPYKVVVKIVEKDSDTGFDKNVFTHIHFEEVNQCKSS